MDLSRLSIPLSILYLFLPLPSTPRGLEVKRALQLLMGLNQSQNYWASPAIKHINNVCKACYYHIRLLHHVCQSLLDSVARTVACSIVTSRIDYCNSLYAGMSASNFEKLQRVQNTLARVVLQLRRRDDITPALVQLHWPPVRHRVTFKIATITFNLLVSQTILPVSVCSAVHSI